MNYNTVCDINIGNEIVPLSLAFVNGTKIKSFTGNILIDFVNKNYYDNFHEYNFPAKLHNVSAVIIKSLNILDDIYCDRSYDKPSIPQEEFSSAIFPIIEILNNFQYYYVIQLFMDLLLIDKRMLYDNERWMKFIHKLNNNLFIVSNMSSNISLLVPSIAYSIQQYFSPFLHEKDLFIITRKQHDHKFTSLLKFMRIY